MSSRGAAGDEGSLLEAATLVVNDSEHQLPYKYPEGYIGSTRRV